MDAHPSTQDIEYFLQISRDLSFSRAAAKLGLQQATLSLAIQRLEKNWNTRLFHRRPHGLVLTDAGQRILPRVSQILADLQTVRSGLESDRTNVSITINLGAHASVAIYALGDFLKSTLKKHPQLNIRLKHNHSRILTDQVVTGDLDLALAINPFRQPNLIISSLLEDKVGFWTARGADEELLIFDSNLLQANALLKRLDQKKENPFKRHLYSENLEVIRSLAEAGVGIAILPERVARVAGKKLQPYASLKDLHFSDHLALVYREDHLRRELFRDFALELKQALRLES